MPLTRANFSAEKRPLELTIADQVETLTPCVFNNLAFGWGINKHTSLRIDGLEFRPMLYCEVRIKRSQEMQPAEPSDLQPLFRPQPLPQPIPFTSRDAFLAAGLKVLVAVSEINRTIELGCRQFGSGNVGWAGEADVQLNICGTISVCKVTLNLVLVKSTDLAQEEVSKPTIGEDLTNGRPAPPPLFADAEADLSKAIELSPHFAAAYHHRAILYFRRGNYDLGFSDVNQAIEFDEENASVYLTRGIAFYRQGSFDETIEDMTKVIELNPTLSRAFFVRALAVMKKQPSD